MKLALGVVMFAALVTTFIFIRRSVIDCSFTEWKRLMEEKQLTGMVIHPMEKEPREASPAELNQFILQFQKAATLEIKEYADLINTEIERVGRDGVGGRAVDIEWIFQGRTLKSYCSIYNFGLSFHCVNMTILGNDVSGSDPVIFPVPAWLFKAANN